MSAKKKSTKRANAVVAAVKRSAEAVRLRKILKERLTEAAIRAQHISAPEDSIVGELCERIGYGAVMDAASRLWMKKSGGGAFIIAGCYDVVAIAIGEKTYETFRITYRASTQ